MSHLELSWFLIKNTCFVLSDITTKNCLDDQVLREKKSIVHVTENNRLSIKNELLNK